MPSAWFKGGGTGVEIASLSKEQRRDYERYIDNMRSLEDVVESVWSSRRVEGRAEGEKNQAWHTARKMVEKNYDLATISELTGFSCAELREPIPVGLISSNSWIRQQKIFGQYFTLVKPH